MNNKYFVHESSYVDEGAVIGEKTNIWHFSHIMTKSRIGKYCTIGQNVVVSPYVQIGDGVKIQNNVSIYTGVVIEDKVFLGPSCVFTNVINPRSFIPRKNEFRKTIVKEGASIGANATIVCGNTIGRFAFVGAGATVTKNIPDYAMVYGTPAKLMGYVCKCGNKLSAGGTKICSACGLQYVLEDNVLKPKDGEG